MPERQSLRVLVVEDHDATRAGVCDYLKNQGMLVQEAANMADGLHVAHVWQPDVVVMDIVLPRRRGETVAFSQGSGIEVARRIKEQASKTGIVFLSAHPHYRPEVMKLVQDGYAGIVYLFKGEQPVHELRDAIYDAHNGRFALDPKISRSTDPPPPTLGHSLTTQEEEKIEFAVAQFQTLTERELEIVSRLVASRTNAGIAKDLHITANAVQTHLRNVYAKVGLADHDRLLDKRSLLAKAYIIHHNRQPPRGRS